MDFFKEEKFYLEGHYMKIFSLYKMAHISDPCMFCPFSSRSPCNVSLISCSNCVEGEEVVFSEIKFI